MYRNGIKVLKFVIRLLDQEKKSFEIYDRTNLCFPCNFRVRSNIYKSLRKIVRSHLISKKIIKVI
jgi:hypothetical protein